MSKEYDPFLNDETIWYLKQNGYDLPNCPPRIRTPDPGDAPGAAFSIDRVDAVLDVFNALTHTQGRLAGEQLRLDPWQIAYIIIPVFGWVKQNEFGEWVRVVRNLYVDVPRKQGKSTLAGGIALYMAFADGDLGAQVVTAATTERQAGFVFSPIKILAEKSPALRERVKTHQKRIIMPSTGSYIEVIASAADAQHGLNLSCAIVDELHVHKTGDLLRTLETGTGSRTQPLVAIITTADSGRRETIYDQKRGYIEQLSRGTFTDESTYGVIWAADATDDPFAPETHKKANPGYGISPTAGYLQSAATKAQNSPAELAEFQRLHLGLRTKQETKYLDLEAWDRNASIVDETKLVGRAAYGGLDLASTSDLCALSWVFPSEQGFDAVWRLWTPEANLPNLDKRTAGMASVWVRDGFLTLTPGNVADYDFIRSQINTDREAFGVQGIAYDPWNSSQLVNDLVGDGAPMVKTRQGLVTLSAPTKELQKILLEGTAEKPMFRHGGNPAVRWQVDNFAVAMDPAGNVKPNKAVSADKIDAVAATINALHLVLAMEPAQTSIYETEGVAFI